MTVRNSELYDALIAVGASPDMASRAAESVMEHDAKFAEVRGDIAGVRGDVIRVQGELNLVKWMAGISLAGLLAIIGILANLSLALGRLTEAVTRIAS